MTKEEKLSKGCTGKRKYKTNASALVVALRLACSNKGSTINTYLCEFCRYYHVGNKDKIHWINRE